MILTMLNENVFNSINILVVFVHKGPIDNKSVLVQVIITNTWIHVGLDLWPQIWCHQATRSSNIADEEPQGQPQSIANLRQREIIYK